MTDHQRREYVGRHRAEQPETVPQQIVRFLHDHVLGPARTDDPYHLFTHGTQPLYLTDLQENPDKKENDK